MCYFKARYSKGFLTLVRARVIQFFCHKIQAMSQQISGKIHVLSSFRNHCYGVKFGEYLFFFKRKHVLKKT